MKAGWWLVLAFVATAGAENTDERMRRLTLPDRAFRDAPALEILRYIEEESRRADPAGVGVNLVVMDDADRRLERTRLTLALRSATVERALRLVASAAALTLRVEENAVVLTPSKTAVHSSR